MGHAAKRAAGAAAALAALVAGSRAGVGENLAHTPPLGWNSWNFWDCRVNDTILRQAADVIATTKLRTAGYLFTNSDDCWALPDRNASGYLQADPAKFPDGFGATVDYIHSLGLKSGIYTARAAHTCAGRAASCGHEALDAAFFASIGIDYVKDDACGPCSDYLTDYGRMQQGIWATGRDIFLSIEGEPDVTVASGGGYGQQKRVGHDITATLKSMQSLTDIGSGLWPFAHNGSRFVNSSSQPPLPWFNDLDMIEIGNGEFDPTTPAGLAASQLHMTMWCLMKSPLILGNDLSAMTPAVMDIVTNPEAIAVNQDPLVAQARRVAVAVPRNTTVGAGWDGNTVARRCDPAAHPTQLWRWRNMTRPGPPSQLFLAVCNASDPLQAWAPPAGGAPGGALRNAATGMCVDASVAYDPARLAPCNASAPAQAWVLQPGSGHLAAPGYPGNHCLDVDFFVGPDVEVGSCKAPGDNDSNQVWVWNATTAQLVSNSSQLVGNPAAARCLSASVGVQGGTLSTVDPATGAEWCLTFAGGEGTWGPAPCAANAGGVVPSAQLFNPTLVGGGAPPPPGALANYTLANAGGGMYVHNLPFSSGPWPHTRYVAGSRYDGPSAWTLDLAALADPSGPGAVVQAADTATLIDDDLVGGVTVGGAFCLDVVTNGLLETWGGPLTGGRFAVGLVNRSPGPDAVTVRWADLGAPPGAAYAVRDIWAAADVGVFTGSYTATVPPHAGAFLVLTPA